MMQPCQMVFAILALIQSYRYVLNLGDARGDLIVTSTKTNLKNNAGTMLAMNT